MFKIPNKLKFKMPVYTKVKVKREPLVTFKEAAESLGITATSLRSYLGHSLVPFPEPELINENKRIGKISYYQKKKVQEWWDNRVSKSKENNV